MIFEKEKYYEYIEKLRKRIDYYYVFIIGILLILGALTHNIKISIILIILGIIISNYITLKTKILIQEMKFKIDIYEIITKEK